MPASMLTVGSRPQQTILPMVRDNSRRSVPMPLHTLLTPPELCTIAVLGAIMRLSFALECGALFSGDNYDDATCNGRVFTMHLKV